jgi:hypothetical protein
MDRRGVTVACATVSEEAVEVVVANDPSPLVNVAVTEWEPTVSAETVADALPLLTVAGARLVPSTEKVIVPEGVPSAEVTLAVRTTSWPKTGAVGLKSPSVTATGKGALSPVCTISSVGGEASPGLAALPLKVAVLEKVVADVGVNCEVNWQAPPGVTLIVVD